MRFVSDPTGTEAQRTSRPWRSFIVGAVCGAVVAGLVTSAVVLATGNAENAPTQAGSSSQSGPATRTAGNFPADGDECPSIFEKAVGFYRLPGTPHDEPGTILLCSRSGNSDDAHYVWHSTSYIKYRVQKLVTFDDQPATFNGDNGKPEGADPSHVTNILSNSSWVGLPLDANSRCSVEQKFERAPYQLDYPATAMSPIGEPLTFTTKPYLYTVAFSGRCAWRQLGPQTGGG